MFLHSTDNIPHRGFPAPADEIRGTALVRFEHDAAVLDLSNERADCDRRQSRGDPLVWAWPFIATRQVQSLLLRDDTRGDHWLEVRVECHQGVNRDEIGFRVNIRVAGKRGDASAILARREVSAGYGYCSGLEAIVHVGLGQESRMDIEVLLPHGKGMIVRDGVEANQRITVRL